MSTETTTTATDNALTPERLRRLRQQANYATCCLTMASIHATASNGHEFTVQAYPWECLDKMADLRAIGCLSLMVFEGRGLAYWSWRKYGKRANAILSANLEKRMAALRAENP